MTDDSSGAARHQAPALAALYRHSHRWRPWDRGLLEDFLVIAVIAGMCLIVIAIIANAVS